MRILKLPAVIERVGLSRSSIYAYAARGQFPKPVPVGEKAVGWLENEIENFLTQRAEARTQTQSV